MVEIINASDGTVYVEEGKCGHGVRTCLVTVTMAGANRNLWVKVDTCMYFFYQRKGSLKGAAFETDAAIEAGEAVRTEAREYSPRAVAR